MRLRSLELFTGAGGLALGAAYSGFVHEAVIEWNRDACASLRQNAAHIPAMSDWHVVEGDVRGYDFRPHAGRISLIAAGAPCQPWSLGGKHGGFNDDRNLFPEVFRAVREVQPEAVVIENVKGLLRSSFREYWTYILACLSAPHVVQEAGEGWRSHQLRVNGAIQKGAQRGATYTVVSQLLNAADYGVPQRRERVFIIAIRDDLHRAWAPLLPTHSEDALLHAKWVTGSYWREHGLPPRAVPDAARARVARLLKTGDLFPLQRWSTVRDALVGLPDPEASRPSLRFTNHIARPGARSYPGHTGSPMDEPAKTLKAGDHGVPGGENMLRRDDGTVRYFTVREAARLQTFPDDYAFGGAWSEGFRQLGNAVPVALARVVASRLHAILAGKRQSRVAERRVTAARVA